MARPRKIVLLPVVRGILVIAPLRARARRLAAAAPVLAPVSVFLGRKKKKHSHWNAYKTHSPDACFLRLSLCRQSSSLPCNR
jgi:hypothetical protein